MRPPFELVCVDPEPDIFPAYNRDFWTRLGASRIAEWFLGHHPAWSCYVWESEGEPLDPFDIYDGKERPKNARR